MSEQRATPLQVVEYFGALTGIVYRANLIPQFVQEQASVFAANFELWELRLVVSWTKMKIAEGNRRANGFSEASLQWRNLIADGGDPRLERFQSRLGMAMEWAKKSRRDLLAPVDVTATATPVPRPKPVAALAHGEDETTRDLRARASAGLEALKQSLLGLDAEEVEALPSAMPKGEGRRPECRLSLARETGGKHPGLTSGALPPGDDVGLLPETEGR